MSKHSGLGKGLNALFAENEIPFIPFSAVKGDGVDELKALIEQAIAE